MSDKLFNEDVNVVDQKLQLVQRKIDEHLTKITQLQERLLQAEMNLNLTKLQDKQSCHKPTSSELG